jgi:L-arabinose isomerase
MAALTPIKPPRRPRVGLYSVGLRAYWDQFPGLRERLAGYGRHIEQRQAQGVDLVLCHVATYATSSMVLPVHQLCQAPAVFLNLQPAARIDYARSTTGEWLAHCNACAVPEFSNALARAGVPFRVVSGLLGLEQTPAISLADEVTHRRPEALRAWGEIEGWVRAAGVRRTLRHARFGFLGNTYGGMLDMYSDFTMVQAQTGLHVQVLEMSDLARLVRGVSEAEARAKRDEVEAMFELSGDSPADPIARRPTEEQMAWSCRVAAAQEQLVRAFDLDALCYYYHGAPGEEDERIQAGFIVGHSLLTARGIPCSGEGDLKTAVAMKICDTLGVGGSYSEIVVVDYEDQTILLGHDGPFHIAIAEGRPILRGMGLYHGKQGSGVSVEAKVRQGPITTLNLTQTVDGRLKLISGEGRATDGPIMQIGNTQTPVRFREHPDDHMARWFAEAPTHHCAMAVGHQAALFAKVGALLGISHVTL